MTPLSFLKTGLAALVISACAATPPSGTADPVSLSPGVEWVANNPDWAAQTEQVYALAGDYVTEVSESRAASSWAVALDLDETVLNNVTYQIQREQIGESFTPESWHDWTRERAATLVPGAKTFIERVNTLGGHVVFVTNRADTEQLWTEENLVSLGLERGEDFRVLLTRATPDGASNKTSRFDVIPPMLAAQGYQNVELVAFIGDNAGDKPDEIGEAKFFCINQGGMYGTPCAKPLLPVMNR